LRAAIVQDDQNVDLVASIVAKLDTLSPEQLLQWLMEATDPWDVKTAAKESFSPYVLKTTAARRGQLGRFVEQRVVALVEQLAGEIATSFELEYLIQALGRIAALKETKYEAGLRSVERLLADLESLPDAELIDSAAEVFVLLNHDRSRPLEPLRKLLRDERASTANRVAAAIALGDLVDLESLTDLKRLAADPQTDFLLRWRAMESLGKLGRHLYEHQPDAPGLAEILAVFRSVLGDENEQSYKVVREALTGYGDLGDAAGAAVLFPRLLEAPFNVDGIVAMLEVLTRDRESAYEMVSAYVAWRAENKMLPDVPESPDRALDGFCLYMDATNGHDAAGKAVATALARAQAEPTDQGQRELACRLLNGFLLAEDAPAIDPQADEAERMAQLAEWQQWWDKVRDELCFTAGGDLGRPSPTP
jgi:hypothetical protein